MKTAEEVREYMRKKKRKKGKKRPWISFKEGTFFLRICPPWKKKGEVWKDVLFHGGFKNKVYCAKNDIDEETGKQRKCVVCRRLVELKHDRSKRGKKLWSLINQRSEGLWNVLVHKTHKVDGKRVPRKFRYKDKKAFLWRASYKWHMALVDIFSDDDYREKSILGVTHPKFGRIIRLIREGSGRDDTSYSFKVLDKTLTIAEDEGVREKLLETMTNLDKVVSGSSDEELKAFLRKAEKKAKILARRDDEDEKEDDDDDVDEDDEDRKKKKKRHRDDDDEDDDDDDGDEDDDGDDDDDDDDLKSQYRKMKKGLKKKKREEEDEDDEDDDD